MNLSCRYLSKEYEKAWHALLASKLGTGFYQSFPFANYRKLSGWKVYKVGLFDVDQLVGGAIIFQFFINKNKSFLYVPHGPVIDYDDEKMGEGQWKTILGFCRAVKEQHPQEGISFLRVEPQLENKPSFLKDSKKSQWNDIPKSTLIIDLTQSIEEIEAERSAKCRYNVRLAKKKGVSIELVEKITSHFLEELYTLYESTADRNKFEKKSKKAFVNLINTCDPLLRLFIARHQGREIGMALLVCFGKKVTYLYGASLPSNTMASYLLHAEIISWAKNQGYEQYDFWGLAPLNKTDHPWTGFTRFKLQFGGERKDYIGAYDYSLS